MTAPASQPQGTLPPTFDRADGHAVFPKTDHDETARLNYLTSLTVHLGRTLSPGVRAAFENRVEPAFEKEHGRKPETGAEVRQAMRPDPFYQHWAALRRDTQEANQRASREVALRRQAELSAAAKRLNEGRNTLSLDPDLPVPPYQAAIDNHLMPGSYYESLDDDDITAAATYEVSLFPIGGASFGAKGDGGGRAVANFIRAQYPDFQPKRIVDVGGGIGGNSLPLAAAFPEAEVIVLDAAAPLLRYGHARAQDMGYSNVRFMQGTAETVDLEPGSADLIVSVMFWHETSTPTVRDGLKHMRELLAPGGLMLHVEQPNFDDATPAFEQFMRDWDAWYNNEPFWIKLHRTDMVQAMTDAGFDRDSLFDAGTEADIEPGRFQPWSTIVTRHRHETTNLGTSGRPLTELGGYRGERWWLFGARG